MSTYTGGLIRHVVADGVDLTNADFSNLARLSGCTGFDFDDTPLGDAQLAVFAGLPLEFLTVAGTRITDAAMATVASMRSLRSLFLNRTAVTDRGMRDLRDHPSLTELTAQLDGVTAASAPVLATLNLERVGLRGADDAVLRAVAKPSLHTAYFGASKVGFGGLEALALRSSIETLVMSHCELEPGALAALAKADRLVNLGLTHTNVTDDDMRLVAQIRSLGGLELRATAVTDAGVAHLERLPNLTGVGVEETAVTSSALDRLPHLPKSFEVGGV